MNKMINTIGIKTERAGGRIVPANKSYKISVSKLVALIIMTFSFMGGYSIFTGSAGTIRWAVFYYGRFALMMLYAFYSYGKRTKKNERSVINWINKHTIIPLIVMFLWTICIWIIKGTHFRFITRGISDLIFLSGACISGAFLAKVLGKDALRYGLMAAIFTMVLSSIIGLGSMGGEFFTTLYRVENRYVELHEALFVIGLYLVCFALSDGFFNNQKNKIYFGVGCLAFIIGGKRIGFAGLMVSLCIGLFVKHRKAKTQEAIIKVIGIGMIAFTIAYIWLSVTGELDLLFARYNINMMNRNIIYNYFRKFCDFSPTFLGHGLGFVGRQFDYATRDDLYNMISIRALHNDYFKMYLEIGFVGTLCWVTYWLRTLPNKLKKKIGLSGSCLVFCLIMYAFITYTTDNTAGYFNFQMHLVMLITVIMTNIQSKKIISVK